MNGFEFVFPVVVEYYDNDAAAAVAQHDYNAVDDETNDDDGDANDYVVAVIVL